jgi:hypothetical protein
MMRYILLAFWLFFVAAGGYAQSSGAEPPTWREHIALRPSATVFQPFTVESRPPANLTDPRIPNATFFRLNASELLRLSVEKPRDLRFQLPTVNGSSLQVELFESDPFAPDGGVWAQDVEGMKKVNVPRGLHYWGIIAGKANSTVAFSFYENQVFGVLMTNEGTYNFGAVSGQTVGDVNALYVLYNDRDIPAGLVPKFACGTKAPSMNLKKKVQEEAMASTTCKQVKIYFEADNTIYTNLGNSVPNVTAFVNALFNQVAIIYANERISIVLGDIKVWTVADPYGSFTLAGQFLDEFRVNQIPSNPFTWDLAHLLSRRQPTDAGGVGYLDQLCGTDRGYRSAFSGFINTTVVPYPTYSFNLYVVPHELGHNFGSPHTHWCGWPGGAIDGCVDVEGSCTRPPAANPGTIMSYCPPNIDLTLGFGPLPGNRIRNRYQNAACLETFTVTASITAPAANPATLCVGGPALTLTGNSCTGCTYQWFRNGTAIVGATNNTFNPTTPGSYTIMVRRNGCTAMSEVKNVIQRNAPNCTNNGTVSNNQADVFCGSPTPGGTLTLSGHTGSPIIWQISTDNFVTNTPIPIATTTTFDYPPLTQTTCFRASIGGLTFSQTKCITVLTPPTISAFADRTTTCQDSIVLMEARCATCVSFTWSPATGLSNPNISNPTLRPYGTTTYTVTGTDNLGCTNTATITITTQASGGLAERLTTGSICAGDQVSYRLNLPIVGNITWQQQINCRGNWVTATGSGVNTGIFNSTPQTGGLICYRAQVLNLGCTFNSNVDTLRPCIPFTCTNLTYTQNFNNWRGGTPDTNTCIATNRINWLDDGSIPGWFVDKLGTGPLFYNAQDGTCGPEGFIAYGINNSTERSIGTWTRDGANPTNATFGIKLRNNTGGTINTIRVRYTGEQWFRNNNSTNNDRLDFQYSTDATRLTNGTWTDFNALDFVTPQRTNLGNVNGNVPPHRTNLDQTITGLNIASGQDFWLRWVDFNQTALPNQDMLGVDDLTLDVTFTGSLSAPTAVTPPTQHCPSTTETYTVTPVSGSPPVTYTWAIPGGCAGWSLVSPNNTTATTMQIMSGTGNCTGITVRANDACGSSPTFSFDGIVANCTNQAGAVNPSQTICSGATPAPITLTGHSGTIIRWELATNCPSFAGASPIPTTLATLNLPALMTTTCFRAIVRIGMTDVPSDPATITVSPAPVSGSITPSVSTICPGGCTNLTLTGATGSIQWQQDPGCLGTFSDIPGETSNTFNRCNVTLTTCYRVAVSAPSCPPAISFPVTVNVDANAGPAPGTISPANTSVCPGGCTTLTVTGAGGTIQWQEQANCTGAFSNISGATASTYNACNITTPMCYRVQVTNGSCSSNSNAVQVTPDASLAPNVVITNAVPVSVCTGQCIDLNAIGASTYVWNPGALTGATINVCPSITTTYTVIGTNGDGCTNSATVTVLVNGTCSSVGGDVTASQTVCTGSAAAMLKLQNHVGNVIRWESSTDNFATVSTIANTTINHDPGTLTQTTCFRAVVQLGANPPANSTPACITVTPMTVPGTLASSQTVCLGTNTTFTLTGHTGRVVRWETSLDNFATVSTINNTTTSFSQTVVEPLRYFRVVVQSGTCPEMTTNVVTVHTNPVSVSGSLASNQTICSGQSATLTLTGITGTVVRWEASTVCSPFTPQNTISNTNTTLNTGPLAVTSCYRAVVKSGVCPESVGNAVTITVQGEAQPGTVTPANSTICTGQARPNFILTGHSGTILRWESSTDNFATVTTINNFTNILMGGVPMTQSTCFRAVVQSGGCPSANSAPGCVTVLPNPVAGTLASNRTICEGTSTTLTLTGNTANVLRWETSTDNFAVNITTVSQTTTNFTATNVTGTLFVRAVVSNGFCPNVISNVVRIETVPVSLGGMLSDNATFCEGDNNGTLTLTGYRGNILRWESSTNNFATVTTIANTTDSYDYFNLTRTTQFRAVVQNGICPAVNSNSVTITILPLPQGGTLSGSVTVCSGGNAGAFTLSGHVGNVIYWESSTDGFMTVTTIANTTATLTYLNVAQTTAYRAVVGNACGTVNSSVASITILPGVAGGTLLSNTTVCADNNAGTLVLSNYSGAIQRWEVSIDNFATFSTIANTLPTFAYSNIPRDTWFRVSLGGNGGCPSAYSSVVKITAVQTAEGGILTATPTSGGACAANAGVITLTNYSGRIIRWERSTNNFVNVTTINNTTATLSYNVSAPTQFRVVLQNAPCPVVYSQIITVNPGLILDVTPLRECNNRGKIVAQASGGTAPYTYYITPNGGIQSPSGVFSNLTPGTYTISVRDANNCVINRVVSIPSNLSGPFITGVTLNGRNNVRVDWLDVAPGGTNVYYQLRYRKTGGAWTNVNVGSTTVYMIMNIDTMGVRTYEVQVRVRCLPSPTYGTWSAVKNFSVREADMSMESGINTSDFTLYPNPNDGRFTLRFNPLTADDAETNVQLYDLTGKLVYQTVIHPTETQNEFTVTIPDAVPGVYQVIVHQGSARKAMKIIIE